MGMDGGGKGLERFAGLEPALRVPAKRGVDDAPRVASASGASLCPSPLSAGLMFSFSFFRVAAVQLAGAAAIFVRLLENSTGDMVYSSSGILVARGSA
jgi:hypothetical protein